MGIDVRAEVLIQRPREAVAAYAMDPANDTRWIDGIREVHPLTELPVRLGSRVERIAYMGRRRIEYILEVVAYEPNALLGMASIKAPFPMKVTYSFAAVGNGTRAGIRIEGGPGGLLALLAPLMAGKVKRSITQDLQRLRVILEPV